MANAVWILAGHRTGSTNLCQALNRTELFTPIFAEYYNHPIQHTSKWLANPPSFCKILASTHLDLLKEGYDVIKIARCHLSGVKFVVLNRKDIIGQAVSSYIASTTNTWVIHTTTADYQKKLEKFRKTKIKLDKEFLYSCYTTCKFGSEWWNGLPPQERHLVVDYEETVSNLKGVVIDILNLAGYGPYRNSFKGSTCIRQMHPQTNELRTILKQMIVKKRN